MVIASNGVYEKGYEKSEIRFIEAWEVGHV